MIKKACLWFGTRGSQVRILPPRQLKIRELQGFATLFFYAIFKEFANIIYIYHSLKLYRQDLLIKNLHNSSELAKYESWEELPDCLMISLDSKRDQDKATQFGNLKTKAEKKDAKLQNLIAEQKLRTQRILGKLIREGQERGEIAEQGDNRFTVDVPVGDIYKQTLPEIGLTRKESSDYQTMAAMPEKEFEKEIAIHARASIDFHCSAQEHSNLCCTLHAPVEY